MGNIKKPEKLKQEELDEREYKKKWKELKIAKTRAFILRKQITEAYEILESIRFDYLADTAFREKIVRAKRGMEDAMTDFLLSDGYWESRIKKHRDMSVKDFTKETEEMMKGGQSSTK